MMMDDYGCDEEYSRNRFYEHHNDNDDQIDRDR
jgi:hypothetical protein